MEFEWQTHAPGDVTSPFYQLAMQHERDRENKKRELSSCLSIYLSIFTVRIIC